MDEQKQEVNRQIILAVCLLWFIGVLAFLVYAASQKLVDFDQQGKLWTLSQQQNFDQKFGAKLQEVIGPTQSQVIHFSLSDCECNPVAQEHIDSVIQLGNNNGFKNTNLEVSNYDYLTKTIPAAPAVAVFDEEGNLVYLGPYSAGYSCTVGNGIVEGFLKKTKSAAQGATIMSETQGCYCPVNI